MSNHIVTAAGAGLGRVRDVVGAGLGSLRVATSDAIGSLWPTVRAGRVRTVAGTWLGSLWTAAIARLGRLRLRCRAVVAVAWAAMGRWLAATRPDPSPAVGFVSLPAAALGLSAGLLGWLKSLVPLAIVLGLLAAAVWSYGARRYDAGYSARDAEYVKALAEANSEIGRLNRDLDREREAEETRLEAAATTATAGVPNLPQCVKSECALPADTLTRLNGID